MSHDNPNRYDPLWEVLGNPKVMSFGADYNKHLPLFLGKKAGTRCKCWTVGHFLNNFINDIQNGNKVLFYLLKVYLGLYYIWRGNTGFLHTSGCMKEAILERSGLFQSSAQPPQNRTKHIQDGIHSVAAERSFFKLIKMILEWTNLYI